MTIYLNGTDRTAIIPSNVLAALGRPDCIQLYVNTDHRRMIIEAVRDPDARIHTSDNAIGVPPAVYEGNALLVPMYDMIQATIDSMNWEKRTYGVECRLVSSPDDKRVILIDLNRANPVKESLVISAVLSN